MTDWTFSALGDVCSVNRRIKKYDDQTPVSFVGMAELDEEAALAIPREDGTFADYKTGYTLFSDGDILAAKITPCWQNAKIGIANLNHPNGVGSTEFHVLKPSPDLDSRYLLHYLRRPALISEGEARMTGSGGQRRVPANFLEKLPIPLPPLDEQRRIADILDRASELQTKVASRDNLLREFLSSSFHDISTNYPAKSSPLGKICTTKPDYGLSHPSQDYSPTAGRYIRITDIGNHGYLKENAVSPNFESHGTPAIGKRLEDGDLLIARSGATVGKPFLYRKEALGNEDHWFAGYLVRFKIDSDVICPEIVFDFLRSPAYKRWVKLNQTVSAQPNINAKAFSEKLLIPVLPTEAALKYLGIRKKVFSALEAARNQAAELDELYNSLATRAFAGEL